VKAAVWMEGVMPERRGWRLGLGITMVILGLLSLFYLPAAGILSAALLGLAVLAGGIAALIAVFRSDSLAEGLVMGILAVMLLVTGGALLANPVNAMVSVTLVLGTFLILSGVARIIIALFNRHGHWGWAAMHGVINLILGILVFANWPLSGLVVIGLFIGIELILVGVSWIMGTRTPPPQATKHASKHSSRRRHGRK